MATTAGRKHATRSYRGSDEIAGTTEIPDAPANYRTASHNLRSWR